MTRSALAAAARGAMLMAGVLAAAAGFGATPGALPEWIVASADGRATAGERFELLVLSLGEAALPEELPASLKSGAEVHLVTLRAQSPALGRQRVYAGAMPSLVSGPVEVELPGRSSSVLVLLVAAPPAPAPDIAGERPPPITGPALATPESPISENDPMYFVLGAREGYDARFQLSFKYRLFDPGGGFGQLRPWLSGLYFGYTQNSLWDLSSKSRPFRDTSYRPSLFWRWERTDARTWIDAFRLGVEHESNGGGGARSRSIDTLFFRPEWHWSRDDGSRIEFTPKLYGYIDKRDNPDINRYRGHVDWRLRYDSGFNWIGTGVVRLGQAGKGSLLVDLSRRVRDLRFGPIGGYLHLQFFTGYGEDILDYNLRRKTQLRIGFAIVP